MHKMQKEESYIDWQMQNSGIDGRQPDQEKECW